ncbi:hypothetical protein MFLO_13073 [Listeria floridensis FSL S10-1187]|uniref:Uncharacterized protein n=1 Tax=Listeria floridensis FSL S10-1187 TaxID=1265817 RepID=A0ABN0RCL1_9LIST|nr:hypothetical protein [Listeria floridensis]EUJ27402.1 hypothetical protein MFLO_13073 [Listeria floridensis FSL S10-1187]
MKKKVITLILLSFLISVFGSGLYPHSAKAIKNETIHRGVSEDTYEPTGNAEVGYPQIAIRSNRTAERTNLDEVVALADTAADEFPKEDAENRSKAVLKVLYEYFASGVVGHSWIVVFNSDRPGDFTSYGYHGGQGYTKNGTDPETGNDSAERKFHAEKVAKLDISGEEFSKKFEREYVPKLNLESYLTGKAMGLEGSLERGTYTPINNCTWFAGAVWKYATNDQDLVYEQPFNGSAHAEDWGMPFLTSVNKIADPGMLSESILLNVPTK